MDLGTAEIAGTLADGNVSDSITVDWAGLQNYPTGCSAGQAVSAVGDTLTCSTFNTDASISLQDAYGQGNTISTSGNSIGFTLNSSDAFTVATEASGTSFTTFSLTNGSNASAPAQLVLITNNDTNESVAAGLKVTSATGTIVSALDASGSNITNALSIGSNNILTSAATISAAELNLLDTHNVALVDIDDGVNTAITGTGVLGSGSISTGFGAIDVGTETITTTGTIGTAGTTTFTGNTGTFSGAIAANGGITFNDATDTLGAHTLAGTLDANTNILTNIGNSGTDFIASTGALTLAGVLTANGGIMVAANQDVTTSAGTGTLTLNSTVSNASDNAILITPSFTGGATDALIYNGISLAAFSPTNASGADTVNGISIGNLTDPGATITSRAISLGSGWDTLIGGTTAGTNLFSFTNFGVTSAGAVTAASLNTGSGAVTTTGTITGSTINATSLFQHNGTDGRTLNCAANEGVEDVEIRGGILITSVCRGFGISDEDLKENVVSLPSSVLDDIKDVNVVNFDFDCSVNIFVQSGGTYSCNESDTQTGVIAQQLQTIFPDLVFAGADGYLRVNYEGLSLYNLKAVQELANIIDSSGDATLNSVTVNGNTIISNTGSLQNVTGLTVVSGGANIEGGIDNNSDGITEVGALAGVTDVTATGNISTTGNISSTGTGSITSAGLLTASNALTLTNGNLTVSSGNINVTGGGTFSSALAANGGITFNDSTDTLGAHTLAGTVDANTNVFTNIGNAGTDFIASTGALTLAGVLTANSGVTLGANQDLTTTAGTGTVVLNSTVSNASDDAILITPSFTGGATDALTYNGISLAAFSPTNASGTDTINGIKLGNLTDPGATITSSAFNIGSGWDNIFNNNGTLITSAELNLLDTHNVALVDIDDGVNTAITGTGVLGSGSISTGFGAIDVGTETITTTGTIGTAGTTTFTGNTGTFSGAIAANGGITFNDATDTLGAHTLAGTLDANTNILTNIGNSGTDFIASTGALTLAGVLTANGGIMVAANQDVTTSAGTGTLTLNSTVSNASDNAILITPSFTGGATDALIYNGISLAAFSPTNASGADTVNGISIGNLTDPGATITSRAISLGSGWDTLIGGTTAGTNLFSFTNFGVTSAGALTSVGVNSGSGLLQGTGGLTLTGTTAINTTGTANTTIGNSAGGTTTIGAATGSDLALNDAQWSITGAGAATFATLSGAGLTDCDTGNNRLTWDTTAKTFGCATVDSKSFLDTTADTAVDNATTNYWDLASENGNAYPNLTLTNTNNEIFGIATMEVTQTGGSGDAEVVTDIRYTTDGTAPSCSSTIVGANLSTFTTTTNAPNSSTVNFVLSPATTANPTRFTICSNSATSLPGGIPATTANITRIRFTLFEVNNSADLAEVYPTNDKTLMPGEVVALDPSLENGVIRTSKAYQQSTYGVVTTDPAMVIGGTNGNGATGVAVALAGRVPVRVSTENGVIKKGDMLTASSMPGTAMKATKAGMIIGTAMDDFSGEGIGAVTMFVKSGFYNGQSLNDAEANGGSSLDYDQLGQALLSQFENQKDQFDSSLSSDIFADQIAASSRIITPEVLATTISLDALMAASENLDLTLKDSGFFNIRNQQGESLVSFDSFGNAVFRGSITAESIKTNDPLGLGLSEEGFDDLLGRVEQELSLTEATMSLLIDNQLQALLNNGLHVLGASRFGSETDFEGLVSFMDEVVFYENVLFKNRPVFNNDSGGFAVIQETHQEVKIKFDKPFKSLPVIHVNNIDGQFIEYTYEDLSIDGFTIILRGPAAKDTKFSWTAFEINDALTTTSTANPPPDELSLE